MRKRSQFTYNTNFTPSTFSKTITKSLWINLLRTIFQQKRTEPVENILREMTALPVGQTETKSLKGANFSAPQEP